MYAQVEKPKENKSRAVANSVSQKKSDAWQGLEFADNRSKDFAQKNLYNPIGQSFKKKIKKPKVKSQELHESGNQIDVELTTRQRKIIPCENSNIIQLMKKEDVKIGNYYKVKNIDHPLYLEKISQIKTSDLCYYFYANSASVNIGAKATIIVDPNMIIASAPEQIIKSDMYIYHATTLSSFLKICESGAVSPLNWLIEGTHEKERLEGANKLGMEATRDEGRIQTLDEHERDLRKLSKGIKSEKKKKSSFVNFFETEYSDRALGRKQDFVYGTKNTDTVAGYADAIKSGVILRWQQNSENYYKDRQQPYAIKTLDEIPKARIEFSPFKVEKDKTLPKDSIPNLTWKKVSEIDELEILSLRLNLL